VTSDLFKNHKSNYENLAGKKLPEMA